MKALQINQYGGTDAIVINNDAELPIVEGGKILVQVYAASLNRIDSAIRNGNLKESLHLPMPLNLGGDFAGVVSEVGEAVTEFKKGDEVYGNAGPFKGGSGSLAEYTLANVANTAKKPSSLDFSEAAALPLAGVSALQGIEEEIKLASGQKILIIGGAGGIGSLAIQIAKLRGAYVAATAATDDIEFVKRLGADEVIDYKTQDVTKVLKEYDAVFDTAGGEQLNTLFDVLKKGGILVTMAGQPDQEIAEQHEVKAISQMTQVTTKQLTNLAASVDLGNVNVSIEKTFPLSEGKQAFEYFETQHPKGKIVINIK